ncbi:MAG: cobalt ECF transporter T component CbiQ [Butyrivibrio sp.]|nr:cobalt ECF transporter T component CbiQ [Butyrivibrio sp.]
MKTDNSIRRIIEIEEEASADSPIHRLPPLAKLLVTAAFLGFTVSYGRYELSRVSVMCVYLFVVFALSGISFVNCAKRIWPVIPLTALLGIGNAFFDRETMLCVGGIGISYGVISAFVLILKGILTVTSCYLLAASTGIENICGALTSVRVPRVIVTQLMLTYRYMSVLAGEAGDIFCAYRLRAPGQRGINIRAWGPLLGQLLIRTADRAQTVYDSMLLRGYDGSFPLRGRRAKASAGIIYALVWCAVFALLRIYDLAGFVGKLIF